MFILLSVSPRATGNRAHHISLITIFLLSPPKVILLFPQPLSLPTYYLVSYIEKGKGHMRHITWAQCLLPVCLSICLSNCLFVCPIWQYNDLSVVSPCLSLYVYMYPKYLSVGLPYYIVFDLLNYIDLYNFGFTLCLVVNVGFTIFPFKVSQHFHRYISVTFHNVVFAAYLHKYWDKY